MPRVSTELKTRIIEFLAGQEQARRVWEIANGVGCSDSHARTALRALTSEGVVERFASPGLFNDRQGTASTGFDERPVRPGYRYRLRPAPPAEAAVGRPGSSSTATPA